MFFPTDVSEHHTDPEIHDALTRMHSSLEDLMPHCPEHPGLNELYNHVTLAMHQHVQGHPAQWIGQGQDQGQDWEDGQGQDQGQDWSHSQGQAQAQEAY